MTTLTAVSSLQSSELIRVGRRGRRSSSHRSAAGNAIAWRCSDADFAHRRKHSDVNGASARAAERQPAGDAADCS